MKSFMLSLIFCFCITGVVQANDGPVDFTSRGLKMISEDRVKLIKEKIVIRLYSYKSLKKLRFKADYDCSLYFENVSQNAVRTKIAFPFNKYDLDNIVDYHIFAGPSELLFSEQENPQITNEKYSAVFLSEISFQPKTTTEIRHSYSYISRDFGAPVMFLEYLFSTGKQWKKAHTQCDVIIFLDQHLLPYITIIQPEGFQVVNQNRIEWHFNDLPDQDLYLEFIDDDDNYMRYSYKTNSKEYELISYDRQEGRDFSKLEKLLQNPDTSPALRNYILYLLSDHYMSDNPGKAIPYMKQLAEFTEYKDFYNLNNLIECLMEQENISDARTYLDVLANQKKSPGFSIYAQLILKEHGLRNAPLDLEFPKRKKYNDRKYDYESLSKTEWIIAITVLILIIILVVFILWRVLTWILGRTLRWKKKS